MRHVPASVFPLETGGKHLPPRLDAHPHFVHGFCLTVRAVSGPCANQRGCSLELRTTVWPGFNWRGTS